MPAKPPNPLDLNQVAGRLVAAALAVGGIVGLITAMGGVGWSSIGDVFFPDGRFLSWPIYVTSVVVVAGVVFYLMFQWRYRKVVEVETLRLEKENLLQQLRLAEEDRLTDVITGIPNERRLEAEISTFMPRTLEPGTGPGPAQLILIDLFDFGSVNKRYGFIKGDRLIRHVAQEIYQSIRRNENMYKRPLEKPAVFPPLRRVYRKYPGGDEFLFLIEGTPLDAVGFVNRLHGQADRLSADSSWILGGVEPFRIQFQCGVTSLKPGDTYESAYERVETCYLLASAQAQEQAAAGGDDDREFFFAAWDPKTRAEVDDENPLWKSHQQKFEVVTLDVGGVVDEKRDGNI